jgi:hypothetical protein
LVCRRRFYLYRPAALGWLLKNSLQTIDNARRKTVTSGPISSIGKPPDAVPLLLRKKRKTESGAGRFPIHLAVRAAAFLQMKFTKRPATDVVAHRVIDMSRLAEASREGAREDLAG